MTAMAESVSTEPLRGPSSPQFLGEQEKERDDHALAPLCLPQEWGRGAIFGGLRQALRHRGSRHVCAGEVVYNA